MNNRSKETVVIIDDDLVIREVIKVFLGKLRKSYGLNIEALSSANGVEGLGLVIAAEPRLVVIDSTLPKYSGMELVDFITSNPKFSEGNFKVIVITEDDKDLGLPDNYVVISKNHVDFLPQLLIEISKVFEYKEDVEPSKLELWIQRTTLNFGKRAVFCSNKSVLTLGEAEKSDLFKKPLLYLKWVLSQFFTSFYLTLLFLFSPRLKEGSIDQHKLDLKEYRVRYYPMISFFMVFIFILISQVTLLFTGSLVVGTYRFESLITLAVERNQKEVNLEKSKFDSDKIVYDNGNLSMKPVTQEITPLPSEDVEDLEEESEDSIQPVESDYDEDVVEDDTNDETDEGLGNQEAVEDNIEPKEDSDATDQDSSQDNNNQTDESGQDSGNTDSTLESDNSTVQQVLGVTDEIETNDLFSMEHPEVEFKEEIEFDSIYEILEDSNVNSFESSKNDPEASRSLRDNNVITYQLSPNSKDWYYINENNAWEKTIEGWATSNTVQELNLQLSTFAEEVEVDSLFVKAFFNSDGDMNLILNKLVVVRNLEVVSRVRPDYLDKRSIEQDELPDHPDDSDSDMIVGESLDLKPTVLNASYFNGEKIISGRVIGLNSGGISGAELDKYKVKVYYTDSRNLDRESSSKGRYIGEADLQRIQRFGEYQYVYELKTSGKEGGFVTAQVEYLEDEESYQGEVYDGPLKRLSSLSKPVKNSTFSVTETGDQSDATLDGSCDYDTGTPGTQCTLRAAIEEANSNTGEDTINFALLESDPNYDPSNGPAGAWTISPNDTYYVGDTDLLIDGFSQDGTSRNTGGMHEADNAVLRVQITSFNLSGDLYGSSQLLRVGGDNNEFRGLVFSGDPSTIVDRSGPFLFYSSSSNNWVHGCYVGVAPDGVTRMYFRPTGGDLIQVSGGTDIIIGTDNDGNRDDSERNLLSNGIRAVGIYGGNNIEIRGNLMGLDKTGMIPFDSNSHDTSFYNDAINLYPMISYSPISNIIIESNILGSHDRGVAITPNDDNIISGVEVKNNCIGTDITCNSVPIGNNNAVGINIGYYRYGMGVEEIEITNNYVGSHYMAGVSIMRTADISDDTFNNINFFGNHIGIGKDGGVIANWDGVIHGIGYENTFENNIIKFNENYGINISTEIDPGHLYYSSYDDYLSDSLDLLINNNLLTNNGSSGIYLSEDSTQTRSIRLEGNKVHDNGALDLDINGGTEDTYKVTDNDEGDSDTGVNLLMNYPEITKVQYLGLGKYRVVGEVDNSQDEGPYDIEVCESSEHESGHGGCLDSLNILRDNDSSFEGRFEIEGSDGYDERVLTFLATNFDGNTSEYSENFVCEDSETRYEILDFDTELIFPIGSAELEDGKPQFDWEASISDTDDILNPNVDNYKLYLDGQLLAVVNGDDTDYIPGLPLQPGEHDWYVAAFSEDGEETDRSVTETFFVPENEDEEQEEDDDDQNNQNQNNQIQFVRESEFTFELLTPVDETLDTSLPFFDWTDINERSGGDEYNLYINDTLIDTVISTDISEYQLTEKDELGEGQHSWYVVALENIEGSRVEIARTLSSSFIIELPDSQEVVESTEEPSENTEEDEDFTSSSEDQATTESTDDNLSTFQKIAVESIKVSSLVTVAYGSVSVFSYLGALSFQGFYTGILRLYFFILSLLGLRSKGEPWGRVYDSKTKIPISRAVVRLYTIHGELIDTAVTDENGVFNFYPKPGEYKIEVRYPNYSFPSKFISGTTDGPKKNIYTGGVYEVKSSEGVVKVNIPIDPNKKDVLPDFVKRIISFVRSIIFIINPYILGLGSILAFGAYYFVGGWINLVSGIVNVLLIGWHLYLNWVERVKWGVVVDEEGEKLSGVEIGLYDKKYDKLVDKQFTGEYGRFRFVVVGGEYILKPTDSNYVINDESKRSGYEVGEQKDEDIVITRKIVVRSTES